MNQQNPNLSDDQSGSFKPIQNGYGIQPIERLPNGGDIHETFRVDREGNVTDGHTTVRLPGGQSIKLPWDD